MPAQLPHKSGDTFSWAGTVLLPAGTWAGTAKAKSSNWSLNLTVTLTPLSSPTGRGHTHAIGLYAAAAVWPVGVALCDVKYTDASTPPVVHHSPTFQINVESGIA